MSQHRDLVCDPNKQVAADVGSVSPCCFVYLLLYYIQECCDE